MKKVYLMALAALFGSASMAQVSVTFQVDMNGETVSPNGVHVAGDWQDGLPGEDTNAGDWTADANMMSDVDADGIYELTVILPAGEYQFKFINDNAWGADETVPAINQTGISQNRFFVISDWHASNGGLTLPAVEFGGTAAAGQAAVRFTVDMDDAMIDEDGVHVAGNFSSPQFEPAVSKMFSSGDGQYVFVASVDENSTVTYKYTNGDTYAGVEWDGENPPAECTDGLDRTVDVTTEDVNTGLVCFEQCGPCTQPVSVTFRVNMELETVSENGVHVAGSWQEEAGFSADWQPGESTMTDDDADGIYELTVIIPPGTYQFKYVNGNDWGFDEGVPTACNVDNNREFELLEGEPIVLTNCFGQCSEECPVNPDPAAITFFVDMNAETISADGVFLIGNFTDPNWQDGAILMSDDDADGIYEASAVVSGSAEFNYKFVNGIPVAGEFGNEEFNGNTEQLECNVPSGNPNGWNRVHVRSGEPEELGFVFGTCNSILSTTDLELGNVAIYPNPSDGLSFIELENPNNHTLRMNIVDITGKTVTENMVINTNRYQINTTNLNSGLYFLNIVNERSETAVYKLMVK